MLNDPAMVIGVNTFTIVANLAMVAWNVKKDQLGWALVNSVLVALATGFIAARFI